MRERERERPQRKSVPQLCSLHVLLCLVPENQGALLVNSSSDCFNSDTPSEHGTRSKTLTFGHPSDALICYFFHVFIMILFYKKKT